MTTSPDPDHRVSWLDICSPHRDPRRNRRLANVLALVAGVLNSVGFVAVATYTSHMTGITALVADHLVLGDLRMVGVGILAITFFVAGASACALLFNWGRRRGLRSRYANVLLVEGIGMLVFGLLADNVTWRHRNLLVIAVLCFVMGLQNALITKVSGATIRTTHVTGMVTDIGIELGKIAYRNPPGDPDPVRGDHAKLLMHAGLVGLFFTGGVIGAAGYLWLGFAFIIPVAVVLVLLAHRPLVEDLRRPRTG